MILLCCANHHNTLKAQNAIKTPGIRSQWTVRQECHWSFFLQFFRAVAASFGGARKNWVLSHTQWLNAKSKKKKMLPQYSD